MDCATVAAMGLAISDTPTFRSTLQVITRSGELRSDHYKAAHEIVLKYKLCKGAATWLRWGVLTRRSGG